MKIVFMGTPQAAVPTLERILNDGHEVVAVWTQPDRPAGRGNKLKAPPVKEYALEKNLTVFQPTKIKTEESISLFRSHNADVAVVVAYGRILPQVYLESFPQGAINVHFSLLPKYRGAAPVNWAIANGESKTGVTTMKMDAGLDTGDILLMSETEIGTEETSIELMERLSHSGAELLSETLENFENITPQKQDDSAATFAPIMSKDDGRIDWNLSAGEINNRIRGFQPFPSSFTFYQEKKLTIWKAKAIENPEPTAEKAGEIIDSPKGAIFVNCGNSTILRIDELQLEGKKRMNVRDFLNGVKLEVGEILV